MWHLSAVKGPFAYVDIISQHYTNELCSCCGSIMVFVQHLAAGGERGACTQDNGADGRWRFVSGIWKAILSPWSAEARSCQGGHVGMGQAAASSSASQALCQLVGWSVCWSFGRSVNSTGQTVNSGSIWFHLLLFFQLAVLSVLLLCIFKVRSVILLVL